MDAILESSTEQFLNGNNENQQSMFNEKKWEWGFLRKKCRNLEMEQFYESYMHRLRVSYLSLFIFLEIVVVIIHSLILAATVANTQEVFPDICAYLVSAVLVWAILFVNFHGKLVKRYSWIMYVTSWLAVTILLLTDIGIPVYHAVINYDIIRPSYSSFILFSIYIFMPLPANVHAFILGIAVTIAYLISYAFVTYRVLVNGKRTVDATKLASEAIFLICANFLGVYFRMMKEIAIRTTFLDRRQCVEENLLLRYARDQEKSLLLSIIPAQIANKIEQDVKMRIERLKMQSKQRHSSTGERSPEHLKRWRQPTEKLFIEPHNDVTILYADVVNYTHLTTTLDVKTLVETLHDLFVKFDTASEEFNVLRIKFLGDCYYCVAGVPIPNEFHAKCCIELGLRMIKDIRDVRTKRKLNIDMRIGVHSGNILSGVIGASKWQYDIWSKDVDVANRLEQTGQAGRVHVSEQTLKLLDGEYLYEEGTQQARTDDVLRKYRIHSFLIKPPRYSYMDLSRSTSGLRRQIEMKQNKFDMTTNFMQNTIVQYNQIRNQAKLEMSRELDKMPIGRIQFTQVCFGRSKRLTQDEMEEQSFRSNITSLFLFFKDWRWEVLFMHEPDVLLKYSIFFGFVILLAIVAIQQVNIDQSLAFWIMVGVFVIVVLICLVATWYKKIWIMFLSESETSKPTNKLSAFIYKLSDRIQGSIRVRIVIYLLMVVMHCMSAFEQLLGCDRTRAENEEVDIQLFNDGLHTNLCCNPWAVTESLILTICMSFLFTRIPFVMKLFVGIGIIISYAVIVIFEYNFIYEKSPSTNVGLYPEYSHMLALLLILSIFHLMDRQTEFISKVDYNWKRQLKKKQDDAKFTNETIKILINNILPTHVADIYMTKKMRNELYYEEYENVAVMFATIRNYDTEQVGLRVLNEIICDFDEVLNSYKGPLKIEKIKVAGWTYMAACGLDLARSEHVNTQTNFRNSSLLPNGRRSHYNGSKRIAEYNEDEPTTSAAAAAVGTRQRATIAATPDRSSQYEGYTFAEKRNRKISNPQQSNVVYVMAQFALDLMRAMHSFNMENLQCEDNDKDRGMLRIGISNGEIMAGVVGSYKPHYDIWGNAVNMASRMDSTGIPGSIQVTEETAKILQTFNIKCTYRGMTYVKGRGDIPTYFVAVDENLNFVSTSVVD